MGEQYDGEFLPAACSNSAWKGLKTLYCVFFSVMLWRKIPCEKCHQVQTAVSLYTDLLQTYPWHGIMRQGAQCAQLSNKQQENKKHQANLPAWLKWEAFLVLKTIRYDLLLLQVTFFSQIFERSLGISNSTHKAFLVNLVTTNKSETATAWGSGACGG